MKRRSFIALVGLAAVGPPNLASEVSAPPQRWLPDGVGSIGRIGVLTPDFDPVPESEIWTMAPHGVSVHASRAPWNGEHHSLQSARAFAEPPHIDNATEELAALKPRAIIYGFTSSSYALGTDGDGLLRARLQKAGGGVPVVLTCPAATDALRTLGAHRVALIHPPWFSEEVNAGGMDYFRKQGFEVVLCATMTPARTFTEVAPSEVYDWVTQHVPQKADAVFISGNGMRAVGTIRALEETLRRPVLTANQVVLWDSMQLMPSKTVPMHYGRIFGTRNARVT